MALHFGSSTKRPNSWNGSWIYQVAEIRKSIRPIWHFAFFEFFSNSRAFPSIVRLSPHRFMILNYSSPLEKCANWPWIEGQIHPDGTWIISVILEFTQSWNPWRLRKKYYKIMSIGKSLFFCNTRQGDNKTKTVLYERMIFTSNWWKIRRIFLLLFDGD